MPIVTRLLSCSRSMVVCLALAAPALAVPADDARPVVEEPKTPSTQRVRADLPTLFVVGDSTANSNGGGMRGWGSELGTFFDSTKINVVNRAIGGRSSRTFINEGRWDKVLAELRPGDVVLVQFGHNDVGRYDDPNAKGRPSLHSEGDETAEVKKPDGSTETVHSFGWYMRKYSNDVKAKGATPILLSMVPHKDWENGKVRRGEKDQWVKWTRDAAAMTAAAYIDVNAIVAAGYEKLGQEKVATLFADQRTHTTVEGAKFNAAAVVAGLKGLKLEPLSNAMSAAAEAVEPAGDVVPVPTTQKSD